MTWDTATGERTLEEAEATLFATCLSIMIADDEDREGMHDNEPLVDGPFEDLSPAQKYTVMEGVAKALLQHTAEIPKLTAVNESAIYYVFMWLKNRIDVFEGELKTTWGPLILKALDDEVEMWKMEEAANEGSEDVEMEESGHSALDQALDTWEFAIDCLCDKILWNTDFDKYNHPMFDMILGPGSDEFAFSDPGVYFKDHTERAEEGSKYRLMACVHNIQAANNV